MISVISTYQCINIYLYEEHEYVNIISKSLSIYLSLYLSVCVCENRLYTCIAAGLPVQRVPEVSAVVAH